MDLLLLQRVSDSWIFLYQFLFLICSLSFTPNVNFMHRGGKKDPRVNLPIPSTMTIHSWKVFTKSCPLLLENDYQLLSFFSFSYLELQFKWPLLDYFH